MLNRVDRLFVQNVREARNVKIVVNAGSSDELTLKFIETKGDFKKLAHDIAMAVQDYLNNVN